MIILLNSLLSQVLNISTFDELHLFLIGAHFTRHQHSHATSCRHFHLGAPQAPLSAEFPLGHASQTPQNGLAPHLPPVHHPTITALPAPPQFQDVPTPPFLPQALHQQYLIQQQLLDAQHRRILPHSRWVHSHTGIKQNEEWRSYNDVCVFAEEIRNVFQ